MSRSASDLLLSPLFVGALGAWAFNDHVLRALAPGVLSGKLGDAASMIAFPILLAATLTPITRTAGASETRVMDACALGTALLLAAIKLNEPIALAYRHALGALQYAVGWASVYAPVPHTMDTTDVLVIPLALLPMLAIRGRLAMPGRSTAVLLALLGVLLSGCGAARPHAWRGDVTVRAHGGVTDSSQFDEYGWVGSADRAYTHRAGVVGASVDTSFRVGRRGSVGGTLSVATGWVSDIGEDYDRFGAYVDRFGALALGPTFQMYGEHVRFTGGAMLMVGGAGGQGVGGRRALAFPYVRIEPGRPNRTHLVLQVGSSDGFIWDARVFAVGLSVPYPRGVLAFGLALGTRVGPDLHGTAADVLSFANRDLTPVEGYGWLEVLIALEGRSSLVFSAQGGQQLPVVSLGIRWELDAVRRLPPERAIYHWVPQPPAR